MKEYWSRATELLETAVSSTNIGLMLFSPDMKLMSFSPARDIVDCLYCFGISKIAEFVHDKLANGPEALDVAYTYFLSKFIACNIVILGDQGAPAAVMVTQLMATKNLELNEIDQLIPQYLPLSDKQLVRRSLQNLTIIQYNTIICHADLLQRLSVSITQDKPNTIIVTGYNQNPDHKYPAAKPPHKPSKAAGHTLSQELYQQLIECVQNGDLEALSRIESKVIATITALPPYSGQTAVESLRIRFYKLCALATFAAVAAQEPFQKMNLLFDEAIAQALAIDDPNGIIELLKISFQEFTSVVAKTKLTSYSRAVRHALDYIEQHYAEKISLNMLSTQIGLSTYYLSNLIKKETNNNLLENINRIRIKKSMALLINTQESINTIAKKVGFTYQNHFSAVFKSINGCTPLEFRKVSTLDTDGISDATQSEVLQVLRQQLYNSLSVSPDNVYDIARIVDPITYDTWTIDGNPANMTSSKCFDIWDHKNKCDTCIVKNAYVQNRAIYKLAKRNDELYLAHAFPKKVQNKMYIVELIKRVTKSFFVEHDPLLPVSVTFRTDAPTYNIPDVFDQRYISENLPQFIRKSIFEGKPLSIVVAKYSTGDNPTHEDNWRELLVRSVSIVRESFKAYEYWIAQFTGDIHLIVLSGADGKAAAQCASLVKREALPVVFSFGVAELREDITDADKLINMAFFDMHGRRHSFFGCNEKTEGVLQD